MRIKRVFSDGAECLHVWAQQTQDEGHAGNVFFEGITAYSYGRHFALGRFTKTNKGESAVLVTSRKYSVSTARHISYARRAVANLPNVQVYYVDNVRASSPLEHRANFDAMKSEIRTLLCNRVRARDKDYYTRQITDATAKANEYSKAFGLRCKPNEPTLEKLNAEQKRAQAKADKVRKAQEAKDLAYATAKLEMWLAGEECTINALLKLPVYCRTNGDKSEVQTSHGARVPYDAAKMLYNQMVQVRAAGVGVVNPREGSTFMQTIGSFGVTAIGADELHVGCHCIKWEQIEQFAKTQNW